MAQNRDALLLVKNGFVSVSVKAKTMTLAATQRSTASAELGTIMANLAYFGFAPSKVLFETLSGLNTDGLRLFWNDVEPMLAEATGDDRNMDDFVVYKNFPAEVLSMSDAEYWTRQICMYLGLPNELFTEEAEDRAPLSEKLRLRILEQAGDDVYERLMAKLVQSGASWQPDQLAAVHAIIDREGAHAVDLGAFAYRGNGVAMAVEVMRRSSDASIKTTSATDVLRIAAGLSGGDIELKEKVRFAKFSRPQRRMLVEMLEGCSALEEDFGRRREPWKRLLSLLHPGDYKTPRVHAAYTDLYTGSKARFAARVERGFKEKDPSVLDVLAGQPGSFVRDLHRAYNAFGRQAIDKFKTVTDDLTVEQLLKVSAYLKDTAPSQMLVRPRGNWSKAKVIDKVKKPIADADRASLVEYLGREIGARVDAAIPQGVDLDASAYDVALASNGQELASYGRGTEFDIPAEMTFLRSASFWAHSDGYRDTWFDNGWNFFGEGWNPVDTCSWDANKAKGQGGTYAAFSGDPTNSKDLEGRGCQMIDLYLDKMEAAGVRYAVWSVLCYSKITFEAAEEVLATLQMGENPEKGKLYEPGRAQMVFPLAGDAMTKFVAYVDVKRRKLIYMDANLPGRVQSAKLNLKSLGEQMPAFEGFLRKVPTVGGLFEHARKGGLPVRKTDADGAITGPAWVFDRVHADSQIDLLDLEPILALKAKDANELLASRNQTAA